MSLEKNFFKHMYSPHPKKWSTTLNDYEKFRYIVNYFTRMRFLTHDHKLDLNAKGAIADSKILTPWFIIVDPETDTELKQEDRNYPQVFVDHPLTGGCSRADITRQPTANN